MKVKVSYLISHGKKQANKYVIFAALICNQKNLMEIHFKKTERAGEGIGHCF